MPDADAHSDLTALLHEMNTHLRAAQPTSYYEPDEPRDVKMAAQIKATLLSGGADIAQPAPGTPEYAAAQLTGIPVEEVARQVNLQWLQAVTEMIQTSQENDPRFGTPEDWTIVCSDHLFEHWTEVENVPLLHNAALPPWSVYLVRSESWWRRKIAGPFPIRIGALKPDVKIVPLFPVPPQKGPSDAP